MSSLSTSCVTILTAPKLKMAFGYENVLKQLLPFKCTYSCIKPHHVFLVTQRLFCSVINSSLRIQQKLMT